MSSVATDKLGEYVNQDANRMRKVGLQEFLKERRGRGDWGPLQRTQRHPAHRLLTHYSKHGVPVTLAEPPWTTDEKDRAMARGPHRSAYEHSEFLREDMADYIDKNYWVVLPYDQVRHETELRISPIGVVPQQKRRPRPIVDYSFYGVNLATQPNVAIEAMQFGRALERLTRRIILANPKYGPVKMIKVDLSDGFYRMWIPSIASLRLAVAFPHRPEETPMVALPLTLPMGWTNSPPAFCTATETIADVINRRLLQHRPELPHRLDRLANTPPDPYQAPSLPPRTTTSNHLPEPVPLPRRPDPHLGLHRRRQLAYADIYVDDFVALAQGETPTLQRVRRTIFNGIDDVFRANDEQDNPARKEPISKTKLATGDGCWSTEKEILGWHLDTKESTIAPSARRHQRLHDLLFNTFAPARRRASHDDWQRMLGELRSLTLAVPGTRNLFSVLQHALPTDGHAVRLNARIHRVLDDFRDIVATLAQRPRRLHELVPLTPTVHGTHDAAARGMGGVWFPTETTQFRTTPRLTQVQGKLQKTTAIGPIVWRAPFPPRIQAKLVSWDNPTGSITNTDLELAGGIAHQACAADCFDIRERTILSRTDNMGALYWQRKGSTTTPKAAADLLRLQGHLQRFHRFIPLSDFIPGPENPEADDASRLQHLSPAAFLAHFDSKYPQSQSWQLWTPPPGLISSLIGALHSKPPRLASALVAPMPPLPSGTIGKPSATHWPSTHFFKTSPTPWRSAKSIYTDTVPAVSHRAVALSVAAPLRMPYATLPKRSLHWASATPGKTSKANWISDLPASYLATRKRIRPQTV